MKRKEFIKRSVLGVGGMAISVSSMGQIINETQRFFAGNRIYRSLKQIIQGQMVNVSPTLRVNRTLPFNGRMVIDPFLMIDHFGPIHVKPGKGVGVPPHPHRGFEPVTFMFEGHLEHRDSLGNVDRLDSGGIQWMTSGKGIIHAEDIAKNYTGNGGIMHGVQLWVNLPKKDKMTDPGYQNITRESIPRIELGKQGSFAQIVAGKAFDSSGPASTFSPIKALMLELEPGLPFELEVPVHFNAFVQVLDGAIEVDGKTAKKGQLAFFENDGRSIYFKTPEGLDKRTHLLLLAGEPINEPVYMYGPFVMNSREEINQAYEDYRTGKMGYLE